MLTPQPSWKRDKNKMNHIIISLEMKAMMSSKLKKI